MAIERADYEFIKRAREQEHAEAEVGQREYGGKLAILGDCHIHYPESLEAFKQGTAFEQVDTFDINGNPTYKLDLNDPLPDDFVNQYDWVIDSGTLYCCFDIATVLSNIVKMTKVHGKVFHTSNLIGFFGRGFYSISPSLYYEFYKCNGFKIEAMGTRTRANGDNWDLMTPGDTYLEFANEQELQFTDTSKVKYTPLVPNDALLCCLVKKESEVPFTKPVPQHFINTQGR